MGQPFTEIQCNWPAQPGARQGRAPQVTVIEDQGAVERVDWRDAGHDLQLRPIHRGLNARPAPVDVRVDASHLGPQVTTRKYRLAHHESATGRLAM